jgi:hypothetical protein
MSNTKIEFLLIYDYVNEKLIEDIFMKNKEIIFIYNMADILQTISINTIISKKNKCELDGCNTKLKLTNFKCKCNKTFCNMHTYYLNHKCEYDYKLDSIKKLEKTLIEVKSDKFEKIQ